MGDIILLTPPGKTAYLNGLPIATNEVMPAGTILPGMWKTAPKGFLLCDGTTYQTSQYPGLASVLGATGDTFTVPNLVDRFLQGANANVGTYKDAGLPNITGSNGKSSTVQPASFTVNYIIKY